MVVIFGRTRTGFADRKTADRSTKLMSILTSTELFLFSLGVICAAGVVGLILLAAVATYQR